MLEGKCRHLSACWAVQINFHFLTDNVDRKGSEDIMLKASANLYRAWASDYSDQRRVAAAATVGVGLTAMLSRSGRRLRSHSAVLSYGQSGSGKTYTTSCFVPKILNKLHTVAAEANVSPLQLPPGSPPLPSLDLLRACP